MAASDLINLSGLIDDAKCFALVRQHRWPEGVRCPVCDSGAVVRDGCDDTQPCRQRYRCTWGQGYGTELARACVAWADDALKLPEVRAFTHPENIASQRVLTKAGFMAVRFIPTMNRLLFARVPVRSR